MDDDIAPDVDFEKETAAFEQGEKTETTEPERHSGPDGSLVPDSKPEPAVVQKQEVPLAALLEERREWKERYASLEKQLTTQAELNAKGQERLEKLAQAIAGKQADSTAPPQFEHDPLGNLKYGTETALNTVQELKQWKEQQEAEQKQRVQFESFRSAVNSREQDFAKDHPDYWQAAEHVVKAQKEMLELYGVPPEQLNAALAQQISAIAANALRAGKNPAEVTYELAKRQGFRAGQKQPDIATLAKGVEAAKTVPSGKESFSEMSLEALAQMADEDFDKLVDDPVAWKKAIRAA